MTVNNTQTVNPVPTVDPPNPDSIAWARNLTKTFNNQIAVENLNYDIPRGSIFGFIGPSGCGKTTTIRLMTGI